MEIKVESNFYKEYENKVNIPYYRENADAKTCALAGIEIIDRISNNGIKLEEKVFFNMITEIMQMSTEAGMYDESKRMREIASYYMDLDCGWDFAILLWRDAELSFKCEDLGDKNNLEEVFQKYLTALEQYSNLHEEYPRYKPDKMRNNICAIKFQIGSQFKNEYYMKESMLDTIELFKDGIQPISELEITYNKFKSVVSNLQMIKDVKRSLKLNKIVL